MFVCRYANLTRYRHNRRISIKDVIFNNKLNNKIAAKQLYNNPHINFLQFSQLFLVYGFATFVVVNYLCFYMFVINAFLIFLIQSVLFNCSCIFQLVSVFFLLWNVFLYVHILCKFR